MYSHEHYIHNLLETGVSGYLLKDASGRDIRLEIDGGVTPANIAEIAAAGADTFVAGSAIFNSPDYQATISAMKQAIGQEG